MKWRTHHRYYFLKLFYWGLSSLHDWLECLFEQSWIVLEIAGTYIAKQTFQIRLKLISPSALYASVNRVSISLDNGLSPVRRQAIN